MDGEDARGEYVRSTQDSNAAHCINDHFTFGRFNLNKYRDEDPEFFTLGSD